MAKNLEQIIVVDLEATMNQSVMEVIEIGIAILHTKPLKIDPPSAIMVIPTKSKVTAECTELTSITPEMVTAEAGAVSFKEACEQVKKLAPKTTTWASWGDYDRRQMERQCKAESIAYPFGVTHLNVKNLFALSMDLERELGMDAALKLMKMDLIGYHHRGCDDAFNIARLLRAILDK